MRYALCILIAAALLAGGCRKSKQQAQATAPATPAPGAGGGAGAVAGVDMPQAAQPAPRPGGGGREVSGGGGGAVMAVRKAVDREKAANDLKQIALFYQQFAQENGHPPANLQEFLGYMQRDAGKIAQALKDGWYVVYWNVRIDQLPSGASNTVLAYEKEVPKEGGWVQMADTSGRRMTAQEFAAAPKAGS
jgi:hypothetical protein